MRRADRLFDIMHSQDPLGSVAAEGSVPEGKVRSAVRGRMQHFFVCLLGPHDAIPWRPSRVNADNPSAL
jgi:hypothetical protein